MKIILQSVSILVTVISFILIIWRMIPNVGFDLKKRVDLDIQRESYTPSSSTCAKLFGYSMLFRLFIFILGFVIYCIFVEQGDQMPFSKILSLWMKWDANNYVRIAQGYKSYTVEGTYTTLVFYPLYSWFVRIVASIVRNYQAAGLITSAVATSFAVVYLYKLVCMDYGKNVAQKAVVLTLVFPFGFFYSSIMSESVFFLTSVMTLYYTRKHNWALAGICGFFAALSRSVGVFLIFPATAEFLEETKFFENFTTKLSLIVKKWLWLLLLPLGTCVYLLINYYVAGDALFFLKLEKNIWHQSAQPFFKTVGTIWGVLENGYSVSTRFSAFIPGLIILFAVYGIMLYGIRRHRSMYSVWIFVYLIINTAMSWPLSLCRYLSCCIPVYIILGDWCEKNKKAYTALVIGFSILFGIYFTGYIMAKQIM